ncbi:hypothetical protein JY651_03365 [Pyxidicoccus parkwayensis]|uniref:Twin-arginine translocation pathway signal n=1 Tax=Pyxidicoccus parkwayensis TaxID=2813578 RepID=A0ABX7P1R3_9BACT|nr:hypothetical protein [Pyxidicoccus parkwaysis]QSQ24031.1 hypothetical protein JY651_03365 [Pyxidicoccus parkwaysis]
MSNDSVPSEPRDATTPERKWSRRGVLGWSLGLTSLLAGGGVAAYNWREERENEAQAAKFTRMAAPFVFAGAPEARAEADWALRFDRRYPPGLFLFACIDLEQGLWKQVRNTLGVHGLKDTPEANLLLELAARRPGASDWRHAFFDAWKALGEPDFSKSPLLPEAMTIGHLLDLPERNWEQASEAQRFALVTLDVSLVKRNADPIWFLKQLRDTSSVPQLMALYTQLTAADTDPSIAAVLFDDVEKRLLQLAETSPPTLQLALLRLLKGSTAAMPFQRSELETLEQLATIPKWKEPSNGDFFQETRSLFDGLLRVPGHHAWRCVCLAQGLSLGVLLHQRAEATKTQLSENDQRWMGRMLWDIGARQREQHSLLEMSQGMRLQNFSSELTHHVPDMEKAVNRWVELGIWDEAVQKAACYRWPLPSLQEEAYAARARDEATWMTAFAGVGELP